MKIKGLLAGLASAATLYGCAGLAQTGTSADAVSRSAYASNGLVYSAAASDAVEAQPAPGSCHYRGRELYAQPDPYCTPGALNPRVTQTRIHHTICVRGWTKTVRPSEAITEPEKRASMAAYGNRGRLSSVEEDHAVALELGGAANDPRNMWPEPDYADVSPDSYYHNPKDRLELRMRELVCSGRLPLASAQRQIASNWVAAYRKYPR